MDDVADYARARWSDLVRTSISLGAEEPVAEAVAQQALARTWRAWPRERRDGDVDVLVYAALLTALASSGPAVEPDRAAGVLTTGAALSAYQAEQVLGTYVDDAVAAAPLQGEEWDDLYRGVAPVAEIAETVRRARRRSALLATSGLAVVVLVGAVVWAVRGHDAPVPPPVPPTPSPVARVNPVPVAWWADGALHLGDRVSPARGLQSLAQTGVGTTYDAVWGDRDGTVHEADADGTVTAIGHQAPGTPIAGSRTGLAAWVDPGDGAAPRLVVWSTTDHAERGSLTLEGAGYRPVAIDDAVYAVASGRALRWVVGERATRPAPSGLLDVAAGVEVVRGRPDRTVLPAPFVVPDDRAALSLDGRYLARWSARDPRLTVDVQPFSSFRPRPLTLPGGDRVVDARFAGDGSLVVQGLRVYRLGISGRDGIDGVGTTPSTDLFTCDIRRARCVAADARVSAGTRPLLLAD